MSNFDVRTNPTTITQITFSERRNSFGSNVANLLLPWEHDDRNGAKIQDAAGEWVIISSAEHADNLIKALKKAKELGWLK